MLFMAVITLLMRVPSARYTSSLALQISHRTSIELSNYNRRFSVFIIFYLAYLVLLNEFCSVAANTLQRLRQSYRGPMR